MKILFKSHHIEDQEYFLFSKKNRLLLWINEHSVEEYIEKKYAENQEEEREILEEKIYDEKKVWIDIEFLTFYREFDIKKMIYDVKNHNDTAYFRFLEEHSTIIVENFPECEKYFNLVQTQREIYNNNIHVLIKEMKIGFTWSGYWYLIARKDSEQFYFDITQEFDVKEYYYELNWDWDWIPDYSDLNYNDEMIQETLNMQINNIDWEELKDFVESNFEMEDAFDQAKNAFMKIMKKMTLPDPEDI